MDITRERTDRGVISSQCTGSCTTCSLGFFCVRVCNRNLRKECRLDVILRISGGLKLFRFLLLRTTLRNHRLESSPFESLLFPQSV